MMMMTKEKMMGTIRQLTDEQAHWLDHLVDSLRMEGTLIIQSQEEHQEIVDRVLAVTGWSDTTLWLYVIAKMKALDNKRVEEYNEDGDIPDFRRAMRAPFDGPWDGVPEDSTTRQYERDAGQHLVSEGDHDPLILGIADRLDFGMQARRMRARKLLKTRGGLNERN
jgi:hypothetical protein